MKLELHHGFALLKEVIHIYAPIYTQEEHPLEKLKECYLNLFDTIKKEKYKSVIVPSLATGFHRLYTRRSCRDGNGTIKRFLQ